MTEYDLTALCVPLPEDVQKCKLAGDLEGAKRLIERRLKDEWLGERLKKRLALEKLALERLRVAPQRGQVDLNPRPTRVRALDLVHDLLLPFALTAYAC